MYYQVTDTIFKKMLWNILTGNAVLLLFTYQKIIIQNFDKRTANISEIFMETEKDC